jgi:hypothetical protein
MRNFVHLSLFALSVLVLAACKTAINNDDIINLPREDYDKGGVRFSLAKIDGFKRVLPDSVGWASYMPQTEENGQIAYLFLTGHEIELASPQVRVEYIAKSLPNCGTEQQLMDWVKTMFVNPERNGTVIGGDPLKTLDDQDVQVLEIVTPAQAINDSTLRSGKRMAWAYVDGGERYIAFNFTSTDSAEYVRGIPMFRQLVRSTKVTK